MTDLKSMTTEELEAYFKELGQPRFRAMQVFRWLHRGVESFDGMTNLPKALREKLKADCVLTVPKVERKQVSKLDGTVKYLWRLGDGNCVETSMGILYAYPARWGATWAACFAPPPWGERSGT